MKNVITFLFFILTSFTSCLAQAFEWVVYQGENASLSLGSVAVDNQGNIYNTGSYKGTVDIDPGPGEWNITSVNGTVDHFIQKLDSGGNFVWGFGYGGEGFDASGGAGDVTVDAEGNVYVLGDYGQSVDFDPGPGQFLLTSNGNSDVFLLKLDSDGNFVWVRSVGGPNKDGVGGIAIDSKKRIYISGHFKTTTDFDPGDDEFIVESQGKRDIFIEQLDSMGHMNWVRTLGGIENDYAQEIAIDSSDNVYLSGLFDADITGDVWMDSVKLIHAGLTDYLLLKLDSNGVFQWVKNYGGRGRDICYQMDITSNNEIYLVGQFEFEVDFNPGSGEPADTSHGMSDAFLQKFNADGDVLQTHTIGGKMSDAFSSVLSDAYGNTYVFGGLSDTFTFIQARDTFMFSSHGKLDMFMEKIDTSGRVQWMHTLGGKNIDLIRENNALDREGNLIVTGFFQDTIDVDPDPDQIANLINTSGSGNCTIKYSQCELERLVTYDSSVLESNSRYTTYKWLDCDEDYEPIIGADNKRFRPTKSGSYAVEISNGFCTDTSDCVQVIISNTESILSDKNRINVTPNPSSGIYRINLGKYYPNLTIRLYNAQGRKVFTADYGRTDEVTLELKEGPGVFFLEIVSNGTWVGHRTIIKQ